MIYRILLVLAVAGASEAFAQSNPAPNGNNPSVQSHAMRAWQPARGITHGQLFEDQRIRDLRSADPGRRLLALQSNRRDDEPETHPISLGVFGSQPNEADGSKPSGDVEGADGFKDASAEWRFILQSYWWLPLRIKGPVSVDGSTSVVDVDLKTLLDDLKMVMEGGFELTNDKWSILLWGLYMDVGTDSDTEVVPLGNFKADLDLKFTAINLAGAYRLGDWALGDSETATWALDVTGGVMFWDLDVNVDVRGPFGDDPHFGGHDNWADLMVGGRLLFNISDKFDASLRAEVGGFGIGSSSDPTWNITAIGEYKVNHNMALVAGFRYLKVDWSNSNFDLDLTMYGPIMGVNFVF